MAEKIIMNGEKQSTPIQSKSFTKSFVELVDELKERMETDPKFREVFNQLFRQES